MITIPLVQSDDRNMNQLQQNIKQNVERVFLEDTGSFTGSFSGFTNSVSGTVTWQTGSIQNSVILSLPSIAATSNSGALSISGMPPNLIPKTQQAGFARLIDNTLDVLGIILVNPDGTIDFANGIAGTSFTSSGIKGLRTFNFSYIREN